MIKISQAVIVEGKYDRKKLLNLLDATIIQTNGFEIFKDKKTAELIKTFAARSGIIIATDSDAAGFKIRNYIRSYVKNGNIINLYIPDIYGKERRKAQSSAEGKLGLEGIPDKVILDLFAKYASPIQPADENAPKITKQTLFEDGLSGGQNSREKRLRLINELSLPERISSSALLPVLNSLLGYEKYKETVHRLFTRKEEN